jgi:hypothetical protein
MTPLEDRYAEAAMAWLAEQDAPEAAIAAHEFDVAGSKADAERWVRRVLEGEQDGAWDTDVIATVQALDTVRELQRAASLPERSSAIGRALDWLRSRQGGPGAWTDGCDPERHREGFCQHFAGGFFSPGAADATLDEIAIAPGVSVVGDSQVRFVTSALTLRCLLLWRGVGTDARLHLEVLRRLVARWRQGPPAGLGTTALLAAVQALIASSDDLDREAASEGIRVVAGTQRGDGSWADADPFHALAVFVDAATARVGGDRATNALEHGAQLLRASQRADGSWGSDSGPRRALIGLRTLRRAQGRASAASG